MPRKIQPLGSIEMNAEEPTLEAKNAVDWSVSLALNKSVTKMRFPEDKNGKVLGLMVIPCAYAGDTGLVVQQNPVWMLLNKKSGVYEVQRTPTQFPVTSVVSAAGDTTLWTPATGKKFRILRIQITLSAGATTAGSQLLLLKDSGTTLWYVQITTAALAATPVPSIILDMSFANGFLSAAINNPLVMNLDAALTAGKFSVTVWGTEE